MKRFHEITELQKEKAVKFATTELRDAIHEGLVEFEGAMDVEQLSTYALAAASDAWYVEGDSQITVYSKVGVIV